MLMHVHDAHDNAKENIVIQKKKDHFNITCNVG